MMLPVPEVPPQLRCQGALRNSQPRSACMQSLVLRRASSDRWLLTSTFISYFAIHMKFIYILTPTGDCMRRRTPTRLRFLPHTVS